MDAQPKIVELSATPALVKSTQASVPGDRDAIREIFENGKYPYKRKLGRKAYEKQKAKLQAELLKAQDWVKATDQKIVMLFEGRDAAGKGGTIKRFTEHLNPRGARVIALDKPTDRERSQWFFQRYIQHLPAAGEIVLFDRSWYNRAGVERVMGFCNPVEYLEFMRQAPDVERMMCPQRRPPVQILVLGDTGRTTSPFPIPRERAAQEMETVAHRPPVARQVGRVHRGEGGDVLLYGYRRCPVDHRQVERQETSTAELYASLPVVTALPR